MEDRISSENTQGLGGMQRPFTFDRVVRIVITIAFAAGAIWLITYLKSVLLPFLVAWLIAYILEPFVQYNKRLLRVKSRWLPITMTLFECGLLLVAVGVFVLPSIIDEIHQVAILVSHYADRSAEVPFIPASLHDYLKENIDFKLISSRMTSQDWGTLFNTIGSFIAGGYDIVMGIFSWFLVLLYVIFIMLDYERLLRGFKRLVPTKYSSIVFRIADDVKQSMNHYFRGQALVAFIVGILFAIGFLIVGLPLAIVLGLFIGVLNMVPYLQIISLLPTTLLCLIYSVESGHDFWNLWLACMAVYVVVQCIQDLFLTPKIMGKAMGLNPAVILLSLSVWGTLLGFIGLIIALPLTTLLLAYYDLYIISPKTPAEMEENNTDFQNSEL